MKNRIILHIDMNSYFASVEQQANPFLRGKPVGVCAYLSPGGCIIASSKEAKAKGIKTGCTVREAKELDPNVIILENEPAKYRSTTENIFKILAQYTDRLEPYSIDEAFLDLTGWVKNFEEAAKLARAVQARIRTEVGEWLGCSVGVSWTKFLAKFAGDIAAKGGVLVIDRHNLESVLTDRPLTDAWGINTRMELRLNMLGIHNLLELKNFSKDTIRRVLGRYGYCLWANVNGEEVTSVNQGAPAPKSVGHSYCLPKKTTDKKYLGAVLYKLCEKTGRRLRALEREAQQISVYLAYTREGGLHKNGKTPDKIFTTEEIANLAIDFLDKSELLMPIRMMAVTVGRLTPVSNQMSLFESITSNEGDIPKCRLQRKDLSRALDRLNDKYGEYTVVRGAMFGTDDAVRDRVGYRKSVAI